MNSIEVQELIRRLTVLRHSLNERKMPTKTIEDTIAYLSKE
jgi:hypothetical protein